MLPTIFSIKKIKHYYYVKIGTGKFNNFFVNILTFVD